MSKRRKCHSPEQIVKKLRDAEAMLNAGQDLAQYCRPWRSAKRPITAGGTSSAG